MKYSDEQRITKIQETTEKLLNYISPVTTPLYNIGEHVANLTAEFKQEHNTIPWVKIAGLRHRLVHHYEDTNWTVICAIIYDVLPKFLEELKQL